MFSEFPFHSEFMILLSISKVYSCLLIEDDGVQHRVASGDTALVYSIWLGAQEISPICIYQHSTASTSSSSVVGSAISEEGAVDTQLADGGQHLHSPGPQKGGFLWQREYALHQHIA